MRFSNYKGTFGSTIFQVDIDDREFNRLETSTLLKRFEISILSKLANMIAAYWFKKHKDQIDEWLNSDEAKEAIAKELASRIKLSL